MRLYEEIDRIFAGMRQVERAVEVVRREEQGQIVIGVMPALSGSFIQRATAGFLRERPHVYVSIMARSSQFIAEWLVSRQIDVAIISSRIDNPYFVAEPLMRRPLVCILPLDHPLADRPVIRIEELADVPQIAFAATSQTRQRIDAVFEEHGLRPRIVLEATISPTVCEFVAAGLGVSLVHPLLADGMKGRVAIRRFVPDIPFDFLLCHARETRNAGLVDAFVQETRAAAEAISAEILSGA
jgi:DNA-binding transcriptional LysR family regulator